MDLKSILPKKNGNEEYYWSLVIEPGWVSASIWVIEEKQVRVIALSPSFSWDLDDELITACDSSCSAVIQTFSENFDPPLKTVFGVMSSWVDNGEIRSEYLAKIKKVCSELTLTPVGFVVIAEALANYFKVEEGGQVNAIFIGVSEDNLELSIFRLGKLVGVSQIARSVSVVEDVVEGLTRFHTGDAYPSRMIIFNSKSGELDEIKQELIKADWESFKEINFLHTPKIETLSPDRKIYAVSLAGGTELGGGGKVVYEKYNEKIETVKDKEYPIEQGDEESYATNEVSNITKPAEDILPEEFGFSVDSDTPEEFVPKKEDVQNGMVKKEATSYTEDLGTRLKSEKKNLNILLRLKNLLNRISIVKPKIGMKFVIPRMLFFGVLFFILIITGLFAFWWLYPKAEVTVYVQPKSIQEDIEIFVDSTAASTDFTQKKIAGKFVEELLSVEQSAPTSGTKVVGDKATGEITIYRAGTSLSLVKNTLVKGPGGLTFSLDNDVNVASGSVITRGITKAKVTAREIGAQYNLASGTTFTLSNYSSSDMEATNESAFSGGTSREIAAVSEIDQKNLLKDLQSEAESKLKNALKSSVSEDQMLIEDSVTNSIVNKDYDKKVGDEGTSISLKLSMKAEGLIVRKADIEELGQSYLSTRVPDGYILKNNQIESEFRYTEKVGNLYSLNLLVSANILPKVNIDDVRRDITGWYPDIAEEYLSKNIPGFERVVINFTNINLPEKLGSLPRITRNISVSISAEK